MRSSAHNNGQRQKQLSRNEAAGAAGVLTDERGQRFLAKRLAKSKFHSSQRGPGLGAAKHGVDTGGCSAETDPLLLGKAWGPVAYGRKPRREDLPPDANLCQYCSAKCCRYLAVEIEEPVTRRQLDHLVWFVLHEKVCVFQEKGRWFILFETPCSRLLEDGRCGIYPERPRICRAYSTRRCEYEDDWVYERIFETPQQVREFAEVVLAPPGRVVRTPPPPQRSIAAKAVCRSSKRK